MVLGMDSVTAPIHEGTRIERDRAGAMYTLGPFPQRW